MFTQMRYCFKKIYKTGKGTLKREKMKIKCLTGKRKKYNIEHNCESSQSKKSWNKSTYDSTQMDTNKCLHK